MLKMLYFYFKYWYVCHILKLKCTVVLYAKNQPMNRRIFISRSCVLSSAMMTLTSAKLWTSSYFAIEKSGFQSLIKSNHLKEVLISDALKSYVNSLKERGLIFDSDKAYAYRGNYIIKARSQGTLFSERGLLFVTKGHSHLFVAEKYLDELEDFIHSYVTTINQMNIKIDPTELLFPHKVIKDKRSPFSFYNKYGDHIAIKNIGGKSRLIINHLNQ